MLVRTSIFLATASCRARGTQHLHFGVQRQSVAGFDLHRAARHRPATDRAARQRHRHQLILGRRTSLRRIGRKDAAAPSRRRFIAVAGAACASNSSAARLPPNTRCVWQSMSAGVIQHPGAVPAACVARPEKRDPAASSRISPHPGDTGLGAPRACRVLDGAIGRGGLCAWWRYPHALARLSRLAASRTPKKETSFSEKKEAKRLLRPAARPPVNPPKRPCKRRDKSLLLLFFRKEDSFLHLYPRHPTAHS